jgi:hypothetical protein
MKKNNPSCMAKLSNDRRIYGVLMKEQKTCGFYFLKDEKFTHLYLSLEAVEGLRAVIEKLQVESALQDYSYAISTRGATPKKKPLAASKKAGCGKKTKKQPSVKKKKK